MRRSSSTDPRAIASKRCCCASHRRQAEQQVARLRRLRPREAHVRTSRSRWPSSRAPAPRAVARGGRARAPPHATCRGSAGRQRHIDGIGEQFHLIDDLRAPLHQADLGIAALQLQAGLTPARCHALLVAAERGNLLGRVRRAVAQKALHQEQVDEAHGRRFDAHRHERVEVDAAHLDVFDAALTQRVQRRSPGKITAWAGWCRRTRSRSAAGWWRTGCIRRRGCGCRSLHTPDRDPVNACSQRCAVALQAVVRHRQRSLRVALVAEPSDAQAASVRPV